MAFLLISTSEIVCIYLVNLWSKYICDNGFFTFLTFSSYSLQEFVQFNCPEYSDTGTAESNSQVTNSDDVTDSSHEAKTGSATDDETYRSG